MNKNHHRIAYVVLITGIFIGSVWAQQPYRVGTTAATFLEIGIGEGNALGDAYVAMTGDLSSVYWNPAGLAFMEKSEALFMHQPWIVDINTAFAGVGLVLPNIGTLGLSVFHTGYGEMKVTTVAKPRGTGEMFSANDMVISLSYSRRLVQWFSFGVNAKYVSSQIWHTTANALALDLGVIVKTNFFSPTGQREDGMNIGMSISNYGTRMKYDGMDLLRPIDILPNEAGNYKDVPGQFKTSEYELPLIFRVGVALHPIVIGSHRVTLLVDALHPNNNSESINVGAQYSVRMPGFGDFYIRSGYKALFMDESEYGPTFGSGLVFWMGSQMGIKFDYAFKSIGILGNIHSYGFSFLF
ncbi:PorV/PorQ family protein [candidate division KSB1 bacterium]|nr:PorV/PorQ family protein [candidate division KSB1 bacterium]